MRDGVRMPSSHSARLSLSCARSGEDSGFRGWRGHGWPGRPSLPPGPGTVLGAVLGEVRKPGLLEAPVLDNSTPGCSDMQG